MRYSNAVAAAFVAGAMAKPHGRRQNKKPCSSSLLSDFTAAATSPAYGVPSAPVSGPSSSSVVVVPVPVPAPSSEGSSPASSGNPVYPGVPSGGNGTAIATTTGAALPSNIPGASSSVDAGITTGAAQSSDIPAASSSLDAGATSSVLPDVSSSVDASITSSALPAESSSPVGNSDVPVGQAIFSCTEPGTFAMTYDDGPFTYTNGILDLLAETDIKMTFFVNGNNFGNINDFQDVVRRIIADGHQLGSHTYAHPDLATLGDADVIKAMTDLEEALDAIIGEVPTYMRPPFFSYNEQTLGVLGELGYHVIHADIDTFDYQFNNMGNLTGATNLEAGIARGGNLALAHDVHQNTAEVLTPAFIRAIQASGLRGVTVGECLGDPKENWYTTRRTTTPTATSGPTSTVSITSIATPTGPVDVNGACGGSTGFFCAPGACCSEHGFCGTSQAYCAAGCQPEFGVCGVMVSAAPQSATTTAAPQPTGGVSPDGTCGGAPGYTCIPGSCCSEFGFCGSSNAHCGTGCQSLFGVCGIASETSGAVPAPTGGVSPDGSCGGDQAYTCVEGACCSEFGFCGSSTAHCGTGCQPLFGICT